MTLDDLATGFTYQSDGKFDSWRILDASDDAGTRSDGVILVLTTGEIRVYKNKDTATAYTGTGGLTYSTSASWMI